MKYPHVREPDRGDPDVCVHCREPWCDVASDECAARLRQRLDDVERTVAAYDATINALPGWVKVGFCRVTPAAFNGVAGEPLVQFAQTAMDDAEKEYR